MACSRYPSHARHSEPVSFILHAAMPGSGRLPVAVPTGIRMVPFTMAVTVTEPALSSGKKHLTCHGADK